MIPSSSNGIGGMNIAAEDIGCFGVAYLIPTLYLAVTPLILFNNQFLAEQTKDIFASLEAKLKCLETTVLLLAPFHQ